MVPAAGTPERIPVEAENVTPLGSEPLSEIVGVGLPVALTAKVLGAPAPNAVLVALVNVGLFTVNVMPLLGDPRTVTTTGPVLALAGTCTVILVVLQQVEHGVTGTPLKVTMLVP